MSSVSPVWAGPPSTAAALFARLSHDPRLRRVLPLDVARRYSVVPVQFDGELLEIAAPDPSDAATLAAIEREIGYPVQAIGATVAELELALAYVYEDDPALALDRAISRTLVRLGYVPSTALTDVTERAAEAGGIVPALLEGGVVRERDIAAAFGLTFNLPHIDDYRIGVNLPLARLLTRAEVDQLRAVPMYLAGSTLVVATASASQRSLVRQLELLTGFAVRLVVVGQSAFEVAVEQAFPPEGAGTGLPAPLDVIRGEKLVPAESVARAARVAAGTGEPVDEVLIRTGELNRDTLLRATAKRLGFKLASGRQLAPRPETRQHLRRFPWPTAKRLLAVPVGVGRNDVIVAMAEPWDARKVETVSAILESPVRALYYPAAALAETIDRNLGGTPSAGNGHGPAEAPPAALLTDFLKAGGYVNGRTPRETLETAEREVGPFALARELIEVGQLSEEQAIEALSLYTGYPWLRLNEVALQPETLRLLPEEASIRFQAVALFRDGPVLTVAVAEPTPDVLLALNQAAELSILDVRPVLAPMPEIAQAIERLYHLHVPDIPERLGGLGEWLVARRLIRHEQMLWLFRRVLLDHEPVDVVLSRLRAGDEVEVAQRLAEWSSLLYFDPTPWEESVPVIDALGRRVERLRLNDPVDVQTARLLDEETALAEAWLPIAVEGEELVVAVADPSPDDLPARLEARLQGPIRIVVAARGPLIHAIRRAIGRPLLGDLLLSAGLVSRTELDAALELQQRIGVTLGHALVHMNVITHHQLAMYLAEQAGLPFFSMRDLDLDRRLADLLTPEFERRHGVLPIAQLGDAVLIAMSDPSNLGVLDEVRQRVGAEIRPVVVAEDDFEEALERLYRDRYLTQSANELLDRAPEDSAYRVLSRGQKIFFIGLLIVIALGFIFKPTETSIVLVAFATLFSLAFSMYKFSLIYRALGHSLEVPVSAEDVSQFDERDLPVYTVLVPMYREAEVLGILVRAIASLDYPKAKLDIKLLLEEDDLETREEAERIDLPAHFQVVVVPDALPKGKPKACNYGLLHAKGEYVVIFDGEDIPEPDQLKKVIVAFNKSGPDLACVQCKLNYFNRQQNLLTRWFTTEYSMWFDLLLPGLDAAEAPIPLGGTSNHFRTSQLRELGGWDPFNVTEDADLGVRLYKQGLKTAIVDSTTYEEANSQVPNWIRQRSRWVKGYIQTWLVHMRNPVRLWRELGPAGFFSFQLVVGGTFFGFLINPVFWLLTTLWFLTHWHVIEEIFPTAVFYAGALGLYVGNFVFVYTNVAGCLRREYYDMVKYALISPVYWALMSWAAWKGFLQLFYKPFYWEKTVHGLYRGSVNVAPANQVRDLF